MSGNAFHRFLFQGPLLRNTMRFLVQLVLLIVPATLLAASPDCAKYPKKVERMICKDARLSALDRQLSDMYKRALRSAKNPSELRAEQSRWLKSIHDGRVTVYNLTEAYRGRISDFSLECSAAKNDFEKSVCSASNGRQLKKIHHDVMDQWDPYVNKLAYYPSDRVLALEDWHAYTQVVFTGAIRGCITLRCKQARIAKAIELGQFPKEPYESLLAWIKKEGDKSPLLTSNLWKLSPAEAVALWAAPEGKIYRYGNQSAFERPSWLEVDNGDHSPPSTAPPFLGRTLTYSEAINLARMVGEAYLWSPEDVTVVGITAGMRNSVDTSSGSTAKCSADPLESLISVSDQFPKPSDAPLGSSASYFRVIEIKNTAVTQDIPSCVFGDPNPRGFYPKGRTTYQSRVVIDDIRGLFVRPDGTFWLKLSDDNWYRFRRNMTSEAAEIGMKYHVVTPEEFGAVFGKCKNIQELDARLVAFIGNRRH
jgi:uncharacterized protein